MGQQKKYILVVNPISGDIDKTGIIAAVTGYALKCDVVMIIYETTGKNDGRSVKKLFEKHKPERILIAGGDGTIKMVAEALERRDIVFGILPAGSANGLSVDLNLPVTIEENLPIAFHSHYLEIDMISINGKKSLHLSDLGLNALLIKNYENSSTRGMLGYALQAVTTLKEEGAPFSAVIEANGQTVECIARMIVIANSQKYGTGVTINPNGLMDDGKFEIVILKNLDLIVFGKIISGNMPLDSEDVEILSADKAVINTNVAVSFQSDGEYSGEESRLEIHILHKQLKVAVR